jgi:hypothetical protein
LTASLGEEAQPHDIEMLAGKAEPFRTSGGKPPGLDFE